MRKMHEDISYDDLDIVIGRLDTALNDIHDAMKLLDDIERYGKDLYDRDILITMSMAEEEIQIAKKLYSNLK